MAKIGKFQKHNRFMKVSLAEDIMKKETIATKYIHDSFWQTILKVINHIKDNVENDNIIVDISAEAKKWGHSTSNFKYLMACVDYLNGNSKVKIIMENI